MEGKKEEKKLEIKKEEKEEKEDKNGKGLLNIEEGDVDDDNKGALLIESHKEQKNQDLDELD
jgi:hypothetical protein